MAHDCAATQGEAIDVRRQLSYWRRLFFVNLAVALVVFGPSGGLAALAAGRLSRAVLLYGVSLIYTTPVTVLMALAMPAVTHRLHEYGPALQWTARIVTIVAMTIAGCAIAGVLLMALGLQGAEEYWPQLMSSLTAAIIIALVFAINVTIYEGLRSRLEETTLALATKELEEERARKLATEAQLASLESRIHPHFLFNTLNTIAALIQDDPRKAERTVGQLAALLRFSLDAATRGPIALGEELKIVRDYLDIETARFGRRLTYAVACDPGLERIMLPALTVQTLVENAVKHGIAARVAGGHVRVAVRRGENTIDGQAVDIRPIEIQAIETQAIETQAIEIEVTNDADASRGAPSVFPPGHGLHNLRERLMATYGPGASVSLAQADGLVVARVSIPDASQGVPGR